MSWLFLNKQWKNSNYLAKHPVVGGVGKMLPHLSRSLSIFCKSNILRPFCSQKCADATTSAYRYMGKVFPLFPVGLIGSVFLICGPDFFHWPVQYVILGFFLLGTTIIICPFATPQTTLLLGLKRSLALARIIGGGVFFLRSLFSDANFSIFLKKIG